MKVVNVSFDRFGLVGNLYKKAEEDLQRQLDYHGAKILKAYTSKVTAQLFDEAVYIDYDLLQAQAFNKGNFKIDYNPSKLSPEQHYQLVSMLKPMLYDLHYTRQDLAFDCDFDLSLYAHEHVHPVKYAVFGSPTGKAETLYFGSRTSDFYSRTYNKKLERKENVGLEMEMEHWWRYELEIKNRDAIDAMMLMGYPIFERVRFKKYGYETLEGLDRVVVQNLIEHPENEGHLSKYQRSKYRALMREMESEDITPMFEEALKNKLPQLKRQLESWQPIPKFSDIMKQTWF